LVQDCDREELKAKIDRGDPFRLVMVMHDWQFEAAHIPGSILVRTNQEAVKTLNREDEIVVYCSEAKCSTSKAAADFMERAGFKHVIHYRGGLKDWSEAGYPLEGSAVPS